MVGLLAVFGLQNLVFAGFRPDAPPAVAALEPWACF